MSHTEQLDAIRQLVGDLLSPGCGGPKRHLREAILILGGIYCGRRFETEDGFAIWWAEEGEIAVYDRDGSLVRVVAAPGLQETPIRAAA